jgi:hypothetical protein
VVPGSCAVISNDIYNNRSTSSWPRPSAAQSKPQRTPSRHPSPAAACASSRCPPRRRSRRTPATRAPARRRSARNSATSL